jgi:hypothetical protein
MPSMLQKAKGRVAKVFGNKGGEADSNAALSFIATDTDQTTNANRKTSPAPATSTNTGTASGPNLI